jgi:hypothetical protein
MKRWLGTLMASIMVVATAGACDPPPPPGWQAPKLESVAISTDEVVAGSSFTVSVAATDDRQVSRIVLGFYGPRSNGQYSIDTLHVSCEHPAWEPQPAVTVEFTCTMPLIAPNGGWKLVVRAHDGEWSGVHGACDCVSETVTLTVTGGSDDRDPPALQSVYRDPDPAPVGTRSTVTIQVFDEHPAEHTAPLYLRYDVTSGNPKVCAQVSHVRLSSTLDEWTFDCPGHPTPGEYLGIVWVGDAIGYGRDIRLTFNVVADL